MHHMMKLDGILPIFLGYEIPDVEWVEQYVSSDECAFSSQIARCWTSLGRKEKERSDYLNRASSLVVAKCCSA